MGVIIDNIETIKNSTNSNFKELKNEMRDIIINIEKKSLKSKEMNKNILQLIENQNNIISNLEKDILLLSNNNNNLMKSNKYFKEKIANFEKVINKKKITMKLIMTHHFL